MSASSISSFDGPAALDRPGTRESEAASEIGGAGNPARRFLLKGVLLATLFYGVTLLASFIFSKTCDWRRWQDPRKRLLYGRVPENSRIILLGDSIWTSSYVKSEQESLWCVMEQLAGEPVFNATLNGADPPDFLNAVKLLPQSRRPGVVFLDVVPTRLLRRTFIEQARGNYAADFSRLAADNWVGEVMNQLRKPLLVWNTEIVLNCLLHKRHFSVGDDRERTWSRDGDFALKRFRTFERLLVDTDDLRPADWLRDLRLKLDAKGYRLVVVVTPVNRFLIQCYATAEKARLYEARIDRARTGLIRFMQTNGISYVDCSEDCDSDCFADLIHTNVHGDRRVAMRMAEYLKSLRN
jgi:hypothetical protein